MSKKPVVLLNRYRRSKSNKKLNQHTNCLPNIKSITGKDSEAGLITLKTGRQSKIIKLQGFPLISKESALSSLSKFFEKIMTSTSLDLQLIVSSRTLDIDKSIEEYKGSIKTQNNYLQWYADYTSKWTRRIAEVSYVSKQDFYIVVSQAIDGKTKKTDLASSKNGSALNDLLKQLDSKGLNPELLSRSQIRLVLFSNLKLSMIFGVDKEPAETKSGSTIRDVELIERQQDLSIDGTRVCIYHLSDLPRSTQTSWMSWIFNLGIPFTMSLHLSIPAESTNNTASKGNKNSKPNKNRNSSTSRTVEMTGFLATLADSKEEVDRQMEFLRVMFEKYGALFEVAKGEQFDSWTATLPLGVADIGITHELKIKDAKSYWPFFSTTLAETSGIPFGYCLHSCREPQFLNVKAQNNILVAGKNKERRFINCLLALRLMCTSRILCLDVNNEFKYFSSILGASLIQEFKCDSKTALKTLKESDLNWKATLHFVVPRGKSPNKHLSLLELKRFDEVVRAYLNSQEKDTNPIIFLPEVSVFFKNKNCKDILFGIYKMAKATGAIIIASGSTADLKLDVSTAKKLAKYSTLRIVLKQQKEDISFVEKTFLPKSTHHCLVKHLDSVDFAKSYLRCVVSDGKRLALVNANMSPMDYWFYEPSRKANKKRQEMSKEIRMKNSKLSKSDVARQTAYYLGLLHTKSDVAKA